MTEARGEGESARDELRTEQSPANDEAVALIEKACNGKWVVLVDYETYCVPLKLSQVVRLIALARQRPGWVWVPEEPTWEMLEAIEEAYAPIEATGRAAYMAALAAAPQPPAGKSDNSE